MQVQYKENQYRGERSEIRGGNYTNQTRMLVRFRSTFKLGYRRTSFDFKTPQSSLKKYSASPRIFNSSWCLEISINQYKIGINQYTIGINRQSVYL